MPFSNGSKWPAALNLVIVVGAFMLEVLRAYLRWQASQTSNDDGR